MKKVKVFSLIRRFLVIVTLAVNIVLWWGFGKDAMAFLSIATFAGVALFFLFSYDGELEEDKGGLFFLARNYFEEKKVFSGVLTVFMMVASLYGIVLTIISGMSIWGIAVLLFFFLLVISGGIIPMFFIDLGKKMKYFFFSKDIDGIKKDKYFLDVFGNNRGRIAFRKRMSLGQFLNLFAWGSRYQWTRRDLRRLTMKLEELDLRDPDDFEVWKKFFPDFFLTYVVKQMSFRKKNLGIKEPAYISMHMRLFDAWISKLPVAEDNLWTKFVPLKKNEMYEWSEGAAVYFEKSEEFNTSVFLDQVAEFRAADEKAEAEKQEAFAKKHAEEQVKIISGEMMPSLYFGDAFWGYVRNFKPSSLQVVYSANRGEGTFPGEKIKELFFSSFDLLVKTYDEKYDVLLPFLRLIVKYLNEFKFFPIQLLVNELDSATYKKNQKLSQKVFEVIEK